MPKRRPNHIRCELSLCGWRLMSEKWRWMLSSHDAWNFPKQRSCWGTETARTFPEVQVHVLNDTVETFQSIPLKIEIESINGQFSKEISVKKCLQKVTGNYRVVNWTEHQKKWPHLCQWSFAKPANSGLVDLLIGIDNAELHYSLVDLQVKSGGPMGGVALVCLTKTMPAESDLAWFLPCLQRTCMERWKRILLQRR